MTQIAIHQLSDPENKRSSPWKVFRINHPQTLQLLSRRGPRSPVMRLFKIRLAQKWNSQISQIFTERRFPGLKKEISCTYWMNVEVWPNDFSKLQPPKLHRNVLEPFCRTRKLSSTELWKMEECHFWAVVMLRQSCLRASRASSAQKLQGLRVVCFKNFSRATFLFFGSLNWLIASYMSYLPVKQIWRKSAVWGWDKLLWRCQ